jgi:hypothetical protein
VRTIASTFSLDRGELAERNTWFSLIPYGHQDLAEIGNQLEAFADIDGAVDLNGVGGVVTILVVGRVVDEEIDCLLALEIDNAQVIALGELAAEGAGLDDAIGKGRARKLQGFAELLGTDPRFHLRGALQ